MQTESVTISANDLAALIARAEGAFPNECCGLLLGTKSACVAQIETIRTMRNAAAEPQRGFEFEAREQLQAYREADAAALEVIGHFHSHPNGRRGPSPTDLELARVQMTPDFWLILAVSEGKCVDASLWQLRGEPGEFVRVELLRR